MAKVTYVEHDGTQHKVDYAQRLNASGVLTELLVVPGAFHGFDGIGVFAKAKVADWFNAAKLNALRRGFGMAAV